MKFLAIDYGSKNIGIAISDPLGIVSKPLTTISNTSTTKNVIHIINIADTEQVDKIILGLATDSQGSNYQSLKHHDKLIYSLRNHSTIPIAFWDESDTSIRANQLQTKKNQSRQSIHAISAAIILQDYLDTHSQVENPDND